MRRAVLLVLLLVGLGAVADVGTARPASAHATVVSTTPGEDARLATAPGEVTLQFDESVSLGSGYARVLGPGGERVDTGGAAVAGTSLTVPLREDVGEGSYVVTWRVVSADSHPVTGAYAFVVGDGALVPASATDAGGATDPVVAAALPAARGLGFAALALALGVPGLLLLCWPGGWTSPRLRRLTQAGLAGVAGTALAAFLLQGPYGAGTGLGDLLDPALLSTTASSAHGVALLLRALCALLLAAVLVPAWRGGGRPTVPLLAAAAVPATGLLLTTAAVGHPVAGALPVLAVAVTAVHVLAMALWLGGLAGLAAGLLAADVPAGEVRSVLPLYSRVAFASVAALVVTGVVQSVREVGSLSALVSTTYGWLLVAKLAAVLAVLVVAGYSRVWVQQHVGVLRRPARVPVLAGAPGGHDDRDYDDRDGDDEDDGPAPPDARPFRRSVLLELVGATAVLAVSAVLVGTPPAAAVAARPVDVTLPLQSSAGAAGTGTVQLTVTPAGVGPNTVHVYLLDDDGRLTQPRDIDLTLTEPTQQIGPLPVDLEPSGPGHWTGNGTAFPTAGRWTLTVTVRLDEFTAVTASTVVPVR